MTPEEIMRDALRRIRDAKAPEGIQLPDQWFWGYAHQTAADALIACGNFYNRSAEGVKIDAERAKVTEN